MDKDYQKTKDAKKRLRLMSGENKIRIEKGLRKMHITPTISFPKVKLQ